MIHYPVSNPQDDPKTLERNRSRAWLVAMGLLAAAVFLSLTYAALTILAVN